MRLETLGGTPFVAAITAIKVEEKEEKEQEKEREKKPHVKYIL